MGVRLVLMVVIGELMGVIGKQQPRKPKTRVTNEEKLRNERQEK